MIIKEFYQERLDGVKLYRTYSDANFMIRQEQTGVEYTEAIDVENSDYTYTETETLIESEELTDTEALNILLGRDTNE
jgi:hypothetical protein